MERVGSAARMKPKTPKDHKQSQRAKMTRGTQRKFLAQNLQAAKEEIASEQTPSGNEPRRDLPAPGTGSDAALGFGLDIRQGMQGDVRVQRVFPNGPSDLQADDAILSINGRRVDSVQAADDALASSRSAEVFIEASRAGHVFSVTLHNKNPNRQALSKPNIPKEHTASQRAKMTRGTQRKFLAQNLQAAKDEIASVNEERGPGIGQQAREDESPAQQSANPAPMRANQARMMRPQGERAKMTRGTQRKFLAQNLQAAKQEIEQERHLPKMTQWNSSPALMRVTNQEERYPPFQSQQYPPFQGQQSLPNLLAEPPKPPVVCKLYKGGGIFSSKCASCGEKKSDPCHVEEHTCSYCYATYTALSNVKKPCTVHCGEPKLANQALMNAKQLKRLEEAQAQGLCVYNWSCCPDQQFPASSAEQFQKLQIPHKGHHM